MKDKHIIVERDEDGFVVAVYCPDETYIVDLLDHADWESCVDKSVDIYYRDVQESTKYLKNCF